MINTNIRPIVRGVYDLQKLRIQMGNRIVGNYKVKMGQEPGISEEESFDDDPKAKEILQILRLSWKKIADGIALEIKTKKSIAAKKQIKDSGQDINFSPDEQLILSMEAAKQNRDAAKKSLKTKEFKGDEIISDYTEFVLVSQYIAMEKNEVAQFNQLETILQNEPIYNEFLSKVRGCGPAMSGVILSEIDITKAEYPSSLHKLAGLDGIIVIDETTGEERFEGRCKKAHHLVEKTYINKEGEEAVRMGITFNPFLKTKLIGVLGSSFLRAGKKDNPYADIYYNYKHRLQNMPAHAGKSKKHIHNMAIRKMITRFLSDLYNAWRPLEGLTVAPSYEEAKLGLIHGSAEKYNPRKAA
jgi:hypothetical protein